MSAIKSKWEEHIIIRGLCSTTEDDRNISDRIFHEVRPEHFIQPEYLAAFNRIKSIYEKKDRFLTWKELIADPTLSENEQKKLRARETKRRQLERKDESVMLPETFEEYSSVVGRLQFNSQVAGLIRAQNELTEDLSKDGLTQDYINKLLTKHVDKLSELRSLTNTTGSVFQVTPSTFKMTMKEFHKKLKNNFFVPTGYKTFDSRNLGIPKDSYFLMAGPSGSGKSSLSLDMLIKMKKSGARVCFIPREMSVEQMLLRVGSNLIGVPIVEIVRDLKAHYKPMVKAIRKFIGNDKTDASCFHFYEPEIGETPDVTLNFLKAGRYDIICDDYINLASPINGKDDWTALDAAGRFAKVYATKNKTIILFLAQLDEETHKVRYSRALVEHASNAWLWKNTKEEIAELGYITIVQRKARNQDPFTFKLGADLATSAFYDFIEDESSGDDTRSNGKRNVREPKRRLHKGLDTSSDLPSDDEV